VKPDWLERVRGAGERSPATRPGKKYESLSACQTWTMRWTPYLRVATRNGRKLAAALREVALRRGLLADGALEPPANTRPPGP